MRDHQGDEITVHITRRPDGPHGLHHLLHGSAAGGDERLVCSAARPSHRGVARCARATYNRCSKAEGQECGVVHRAMLLDEVESTVAMRTRAPSCRSVGGLITM